MNIKPLTSMLRIVALTVLFSAAAVYEGAHLSALSTIEVWVHLRTGLWILQNHSVPHTGLFSQYSNLPWNDSSWGFDVLISGAHRLLGLRAIVIVLMLFKVALAVATYLLARGARASFWTAVLLSAMAQYVISGLQPLPYAFSILFFAVELGLLVRCRQTGEVRDLFWLPVLFVLWANVHLQFVAGLILLGLFVIAVGLEQMLRSAGTSWVSRDIASVPLGPVGAVAGLSLVGTWVTPYFFHQLPEAFRTLYSHVGFEHFSEMTSMSFRRPQEFAIMLLLMTAFLVLGRQRSLALFELLILVAGTLVAFRIQRDGWLAVLPAVAIVSSVSRWNRGESESMVHAVRSREWIWGAALTAVIVVFAVVRLPESRALMATVSQQYPVKACDYIRENRLPQPLFNDYSWGSFLTWYLPEYPVAVDGRVEFYGDDMLGSYFDVVGGKQLLESDARVARAGTLLLERESGMAKALVNLPKLSAEYRLVYSDDLASVFVPQAHSD